MDKFRKVLGAKIHRATVTHADLEYEGSITLPPYLMQASDIRAYEAVHVWNITRGSRFETYAITGEENSSDICINGAAAHLTKPGDMVIIVNFIEIPESEVGEYQPKIVFVDKDNQIARIGQETPGPKRVQTSSTAH